MGSALRAEAIKLWSVRSTKVLIGVALLVGVGITVLVTAVVPADDPEITGATFELALAGLGLARPLVGVLGILLITQEYRYGTLKVTFSADPHRTRVMASKAAVIAVLALVLGTVIVVADLVIGGLILDARGFDVAVGGADFWRASVGAVALTVLHGLVGLGLGAILTNPIAAIVLYVVWQLLVEPIVLAVEPEVGKWLPFAAGDALTAIDAQQATLAPWTGGLVFAAFTVALLGVGTLLVNRRDA